MSRLPLTFDSPSISCSTKPVGFANRLLSMSCVLSMAKELNYKPVMVWRSDGIVGGVRFGDLFDTTDLPFKLVEGYQAQITRFAIRIQEKDSNAPQRILGSLILKLLPYDKIIRIQGSKAHNRFRETKNLDLSTYRRIMIYAHNLFRYEYDVSWLKPAPPIASHIAELKKQFTPNTVGIHFRGTESRTRDGTIPPLDKIIARMHAEVELDPDVKFFLASDGDELGKVIIDTFGDRLIINTGDSARASTGGQWNAVADLFGLASTSRVIGPRYSSFSMLATMIGNKPSLRITSLSRVLNPGGAS